MSSSMDEKIAAARKEVLVDLVKLAQKRGMKGSKGGWKEFISVYDKKFGASLSDPARRSADSLVAFLKTFGQVDDLKFFDKVIQSHAHRHELERIQENPASTECPEQRLVCLTVGHPQYPSSYSFPSHEEGWLVTKRSKKSKEMKSTKMVAVDCEMVLCEDDSDALVRVCVVDRDLKVKLDELVNPNKPVADFRTEITGVSAKDLEGANCSLEDIQKSMKKLLSHGTILVGHSLNNDLLALKIDHARVIDTSYVFRYANASNLKRPSLNNLCKSVLGYELRKKDHPHNCLDDARATMKLVLAIIDGGVDNSIPLVHNDVPATDMAKLLLHRIPTSIPGEELRNIIPGDFSIEIKPNKIGDQYSAFAIFKNQQEANQAFDELDGSHAKDSSGRSQKLISFQLKTGKTGSLCLRKMTEDDHFDQVAQKKRSSKNEDPFQSKKLKTEQAVEATEGTDSDANQSENLLEIKRLKQELRERDQEILSLNKIIVALARKQGL